jgi:osmotically-inducible protein OsmY
VVQGLAHDLTETFRPDREFDDETLHQKVKSEAIGRWDGSKNDIEVHVDNGVVTLKGNVGSENVDDLIRLVKGVPGVASVNDQLSIPQRS